MGEGHAEPGTWGVEDSEAGDAEDGAQHPTQEAAIASDERCSWRRVMVVGIQEEAEVWVSALAATLEVDGHPLPAAPWLFSQTLCGPGLRSTG